MTASGEDDAAATERPQGDRRQGDRRIADRRQRGRRSEDHAGAAPAAPESTPARPSRLDSAWGPTGIDIVAEVRDGSGPATPSGQALARLVRTYVAARAVIGVALVAALAAAGAVGARVVQPAIAVCLVYALQAVVLWLLPRFRELAELHAQPPQRRRQWLATIGVDLLAFSLLHLLDPGSTFNFAALLVLPVLMSGVMASRLLALATASVVALWLLGVAWRGSIGTEGSVLGLAQSGLAGIGLFVIALLAGELAARLVREEVAARGSREVARQQAQLSRLVIEEMTDGVLVVDEGLRVRAANPAARRLLAPQGMSAAAPFQLQSSPAWAALGAAVQRALSDRQWPDEGREVPVAFGEGHARMLRVRVRFMRRPLDADGTAVPSEGLCVLLLEDVRTVQARVRQEKLAAMGRVSAGVAHEIRNPLAAIGQANALLLEDELLPTQARLARIVADNVRRLQRIVEDVLEVAPGAATQERVVDARAEMAAAVAEWARTVGIALGPGSRLRADLPIQPLTVRFDPEHLRRVLVNLLDNAARHGTGEPEAIVLRLAVRDEQTAVLSVASDGPPIGPDVERYLFEPFFSTRSRGTGLGLYICRELCERYGATIEFRPRAASERHRNGFVVVLRRALSNDSAAAPAPVAT
jgi:two-component system sensor histidine kinase PilS (NtrC family)